LIERNETFLEHLFEVANDPNKNLIVFVTFLEEKEGLKKIFNRTKPARVDVSVTEDREKIVLHRLFENADNKNIDKIEKIIQNYLKNYSEPIKIENPYKYKQEMISGYPFHPLLLESLTQVFEAAADRQNMRAMMNILADLIKDKYDKKDLLLISDLNENDFRGIDLQLVEKFNYDLERIKELAYGKW
jgi:predicted AAA+ superfamily ATPase